MWGKIIIPMYRLWLNGLYGLYGPRCPLSSKRPINLISLSLCKRHSRWYSIYMRSSDLRKDCQLGTCLTAGVTFRLTSQTSRFSSCQGAPAVKGYQLSRGTSCQGAPAVKWHQLSRGTSCQVAPAVKWHQLSRGTSCQGVPAVKWYQLSRGTSCQVVPAVKGHQLSRGTSCHVVPAVKGHQLSRGTSCHVVPAVKGHQLSRGTSCQGVPAVKGHQLSRGTSCQGAPAVKFRRLDFLKCCFRILGYVKPVAKLMISTSQQSSINSCEYHYWNGRQCLFIH